MVSILQRAAVMRRRERGFLHNQIDGVMWRQRRHFSPQAFPLLEAAEHKWHGAQNLHVGMTAAAMRKEGTKRQPPKRRDSCTFLAAGKAQSDTFTFQNRLEILLECRGGDAYGYAQH